MKAKTEFDKILKRESITLKDFCEFWHIPYRTAQNWRLGLRRTPDWVLRLLEFESILCPVCDGVFLLERDRFDESWKCPYCSTSMDDEDLLDDFIFLGRKVSGD